MRQSLFIPELLPRNAQIKFAKKRRWSKGLDRESYAGPVIVLHHCILSKANPAHDELLSAAERREREANEQIWRDLGCRYVFNIIGILSMSNILIF